VSTQDQSVDLQRVELLKFAEARGWKVFGVFEDVGSGTNENRVQLQAVLAEARNRSIDILLCWKLDRVFRSLKNLVGTIQELDDLGVKFVSLRDQIDMTTASGRLMTHILAAFAEFEADLIRERVKAGIANARRKGKRIGRPITCDVDGIRTMRSKGLSYRQIARSLDVSVASVQRAVRGVSKPLPKSRS